MCGILCSTCVPDQGLEPKGIYSLLVAGRSTDHWGYGFVASPEEASKQKQRCHMPQSYHQALLESFLLLLMEFHASYELNKHVFINVLRSLLLEAEERGLNSD